MAISKVVYGGSTLVDLTSDTVTPETLLEGVTAHDKSGALIVGTMVQYTPLDAYPVGSVYISEEPVSPAVLFGGTWTQISDRFLLAAGPTYTAGSTGGSATHTHAKNETGQSLSNVKNVSGSYVVSTGNYVKTVTALPPYEVYYMWKRTA